MTKQHPRWATRLAPLLWLFAGCGIGSCGETERAAPGSHAATGTHTTHASAASGSSAAQAEATASPAASVEPTASRPPADACTEALGIRCEVYEEAYLKASNTDTGTDEQFGLAVALDGDTLVVGAPREDSAARGVNGGQANNDARSSGAVYVFVRNAGVWTQEAYLKASNTGEVDWFGHAVSLDGNTLAVSALFESSDARGANGNQANNRAERSGAVYVFVRNATGWTQEAYLKASNTNAGDHFGYELALDGDTLAVGAWGEGSAATGVNGDQADNNAPESGAVYVFVRNRARWTQQAYLKASNTDAGDLFGGALALQGDTLVVGAGGEGSAALGLNGDQANNDARESGAVYVFARSAGRWTQAAYLKAFNTNAEDRFGLAVALDDNTLSVSARGEGSAVRGVGGDPTNNGARLSGAVFVFTRSAAGWTQEAYLKASNTDTMDAFGESLALDGNTLVVGANLEDSAARGVNGDQENNEASSSGAVYVFERSATGWTQTAYLKASNTDAGDYFGASLALDANTLAIGAFLEGSAARGVNGDQANNDGREAGAVYVRRIAP